jgi:hypothetical protein
MDPEAQSEFEGSDLDTNHLERVEPFNLDSNLNLEYRVTFP